jgi:integrase
VDQVAGALGASYPNSGHLFVFEDGRCPHPDTITRHFNKLVDRAGVPMIRLHDVRDTYATLSLDAGVDLKIVSDRIGHANVAVTAQIYGHRSTGQDRPAAEKMAGMILDFIKPASLADAAANESDQPEEDEPPGLAG